MGTGDQVGGAVRPAGRGGRSASRWAVAVVLVLAVAGFYALGLGRYFSWEYVRSHLDAWQAEARQNRAPALALFFLVYAAVTALSLPVAALLTLTAGALFGRWLGTGVVSLASTLGATLAFLSSRYLLRDWVQRRYGGRLGPVNRGVERDGGYYLFTLRLVPLVPFWLINLGMGLTPLRVRTFVLVSWLGMLPGTFLYVNAGTALAGVDRPRDILSPGVLGSLVLVGVAPLLIRRLVRWRGHLWTLVLATASMGTADAKECQGTPSPLGRGHSGPLVWLADVSVQRQPGYLGADRCRGFVIVMVKKLSLAATVYG